jgi:hypothetical protein
MWQAENPGAVCEEIYKPHSQSIWVVFLAVINQSTSNLHCVHFIYMLVGELLYNTVFNFSPTYD